MRVRGTLKKDVLVFAERMGISQEDKTEGWFPVWGGETLGRSLGSHDAIAPVRGMCNGSAGKRPPASKTI